MMKKLFALFLALALVMGLWGCAPSGNAPLAYGLILTEDTPYQQQIRAGYEAAAGKAGLQILVRYAATAEAQLQAIQELQGSISALAIRPADGTSLKDALNDLSIPVATVDADTEGSDYFIDPVDYKLCARAMLDQVLEITGGSGEFAILASDRFSGSNIWVNVLNAVMQEAPYAGLTFVKTVYCAPEAETAAAETQSLLTQYPALEAICCPESAILLGCCQTLTDANTQVRATGMAVPSALKDFVGENKVCPAFFLWDPSRIGQCAFETLCFTIQHPLTTHTISFKIADGTVYAVKEGSIATLVIAVGEPARFNGENIAHWAQIY